MNRPMYSLKVKAILLTGLLMILYGTQLASQNVGIGIVSPAAKLHVKGTADVSQLLIDANATQSNSNPLLKLRNSSGADLLSIHSDHSTNSFVGLNVGRFNDATGGGTGNSFFGSFAGGTTTVGASNTVFGTQALSSN